MELADVKLRADERFVLESLAEAWNAYVNLPGKDSSDTREFNAAIHAAQHIVALRVARRADPDFWSPPDTMIPLQVGGVPQIV